MLNYQATCDAVFASAFVTSLKDMSAPPTPTEVRQAYLAGHFVAAAFMKEHSAVKKEAYEAGMTEKDFCEKEIAKLMEGGNSNG